jgi:hypothetical protein
MQGMQHLYFVTSCYWILNAPLAEVTWYTYKPSFNWCWIVFVYHAKGLLFIMLGPGGYPFVVVGTPSYCTLTGPLEQISSRPNLGGGAKPKESMPSSVKKQDFSFSPVVRVLQPQIKIIWPMIDQFFRPADILWRMSYKFMNTCRSLSGIIFAVVDIRRRFHNVWVGAILLIC